MRLIRNSFASTNARCYFRVRYVLGRSRLGAESKQTRTQHVAGKTSYELLNEFMGDFEANFRNLKLASVVFKTLIKIAHNLPNISVI